MPNKRDRRKTFVLDTNVLLHDPQCVERFGSNDVVIPLDVVGELDKFKGEQSDRGAAARQVTRNLMQWFAGRDPSNNVRLGDTKVRSCVFEEPDSKEVKSYQGDLGDWSYVDNRLLVICNKLRKPGKTVVLVTNDMNLCLKASMLGIYSEGYRLGESKEVETKSDVSDNGLDTIAMSDEAMAEFMQAGNIPWSGLDNYPDNTFFNLVHSSKKLQGKDCAVVLKRDEGGRSWLHRLDAPTHLNVNGGIRGVKPRSDDQRILLRALTDPDIKFVTITGKAGTGKTFLTLAAALEQVLANKKDNPYDGIIVSRPVIGMGNDVGFLPGDLMDKLAPWMQPIYDNLEILCKKEVKKSSKPQQGKPVKPYQHLLDSGILELEALCFIRGRSIPKKFFIVDEAQQLTPHEAKTILTRMAEGSKIVFIGDPDQIDNPRVDSRSNGMVYAKNKLAGCSFSAHVNLTKGERSEIAEAAADLM